MLEKRDRLESISVYTEKMAAEGEDAPPLELLLQPGLRVLAVADGVGGSGGRKYKDASGNEHTGAFFASRAAIGLLEAYVNEKRPELQDKACRENGLASSFFNEMGLFIAAGMQKERALLDGGTSLLKSMLIKELPTTLAGVALHDTGSEAWGTAFWAGDSRCYLMTPDCGLVQISKDHLGLTLDALDNLERSAPLSNFVSADEDNRFRIEHKEFRITGPAVVFAATDGFFDCFRSPMHFESFLLDSLHRAQDMEDMARLLEAEIAGVSCDDASLALAACGVGSFALLKRSFERRASIVKRQYVAPLDVFDKKINRRLAEIEMLEGLKRDMTRSLWLQYKPVYEDGRNSMTSRFGIIGGFHRIAGHTAKPLCRSTDGGGSALQLVNRLMRLFGKGRSTMDAVFENGQKGPGRSVRGRSAFRGGSFVTGLYAGVAITLGIMLVCLVLQMLGNATDPGIPGGLLQMNVMNNI